MKLHGILKGIATITIGSCLVSTGFSQRPAGVHAPAPPGGTSAPGMMAQRPNGHGGAPSSPQRNTNRPSFSQYSSPQSNYNSAPGRSKGKSQQIPNTRFGPMPDSRRVPRQSPFSDSRPGSSASGPQFSPRGAAPPGRNAGPPEPLDTSRMQQALRRGDYDAVGKESQGIRSQANRIEGMGPDLSVQDRLKLPLLNKMVRQGTDLVDEGRSSQDESKIRMGIQQIDEANEKLDRLEGSIRSQAGNPNPKNRNSARPD